MASSAMAVTSRASAGEWMTMPSSVLRCAERGSKLKLPMKMEIVEDEGQGRSQSVCHQPLAGKGLAHPVADRGSLGDAPPDIAEVDAADQPAAFVGEDEQAIGFAGAPFPDLLAQAAAEMVAPQGILRPGRLPRGQKSPTPSA